MKIITIFLLAVSLYSFQDNTSSNKIAERANRIKAKLLYSKSLPPIIIKSENFSPDKIDESFIYNTFRKENNSVDSILMTVSIFLKDSLQHLLSFNEIHLKSKETYMYKVNKQGIIDWAYKADDPENMNTEIIEIMTDSAIYNYSPKIYPIKKPDEKTRAFYEAKLITSLDELEKILFSK
jgi:hypothetical protein